MKFTTMVATLTMASSITLTSEDALGAEENLDLEFIEFLGQISEVEEMGVDVDELLDMNEPDAQSDETEQSE